MKRWRAALCVVAGTLAGCGAPTQYQGPIAINRQGLASRLAWVCAAGPADPASVSPCALDHDPAVPAPAASLPPEPTSVGSPTALLDQSPSHP